MNARHAIISKDIVTDAAFSAARVFRTPADVSRHGKDGKNPWDGNTAIGYTRLDPPVWIGGSTTGYPIMTGSQDIIIPRGSIGTQWSRDAQPLDTSVNGIDSKHRDPAPTWSKVIGRKFTDKSITNVNSRCRMNLTCNTVLPESPNFVNLGLSSVHTLDELGYVFIPTTIIGRDIDGSNWLPPGHCISKVTADRVIRTGSEQGYNSKNDFEIGGKIKILGAKIIL